MKTAFFIFGDTQFHPWQESERPDRWKKMVDVLDFVYTKAEKYKEENQEDEVIVVFLGDLFESKTRVRNDVFSYVLEEFRECIESSRCRDVETILVAGNHDYKNKECTLNPLDSDSFILTSGIDRVYSSQITKHCKFLVIPYPVEGADDSDKYEILDRYPIAFTHIDIPGVELNNGVKSEKLGVDRKLLNKCQYVFNGHYHIPGKLKIGNTTVVNVGAPFHHNWSDLDTGPRFISRAIVEDGKVSHARIPVKDFPQFISDKSNARKIDFVQPDINELYEESTSEEEDNERVLKSLESGSMFDIMAEYAQEMLGKKTAKKYLEFGKNLLEEEGLKHE